MEYLKRFALWFITGFAVTLGISTAMLLSTLVKDYSYIFQPVSPVPVEKLALSATELSTVTKQLTLTGVLTNNSEQDLSEVVVKVELHHNDKVLHHCTDTLSKLPAAGKSLPFTADCYRVETRDIPMGSSHRITVVSAYGRS